MRSAKQVRLVATEVTWSACSSAARTKGRRSGSKAYLPTSLPRIETIEGRSWSRATAVAMNPDG